MDRSERKIKQTVSHNAETADRDRVKNKETSDYTRKYVNPFGPILFHIRKPLCSQNYRCWRENLSREFSAEESAALSGNKHIPDLDKKRADIWLMQLRVQFPSGQPPYGSIKNITYAKEGVKIAGGKGNPRHIRQARSPFGSILFRIRGFQKSRIRIRSRRDCKQTARWTNKFCFCGHYTLQLGNSQEDTLVALCGKKKRILTQQRPITLHRAELAGGQNSL